MSEVKSNDETTRWHITSDGLDVFINGFGQPKLHYTWNEMYETIIDFVNSNTYLEQEELPTSRLSNGMLVSLEDRQYRVENINLRNNTIELADITFAQGTGFPIFRKEPLGRFENELENAGFFNAQDEKQTSPIGQLMLKKSPYKLKK